MQSKHMVCWRYRMVDILSTYHPWIFHVADRLRLVKKGRVDGSLDVVVAAFPRSASNFAIYCLKQTKENPVQRSLHTHTAAHVIAAVEQKVPCLVIVRDPKDAVLSLIIREPALTAKLALKGYVAFHTQIEPHRSGFVVATFDEVTTDFSIVTRRLADRYEGKFGQFEHTEENVQRILDTIHARSYKVHGEQAELVSCRPSAKRQGRKEDLAPAFDAPARQALRDEAYRQFDKFRTFAIGAFPED